MNKNLLAMLGTAALSVTLSLAVTPAFALGNCGPNAHRNQNGQCVAGGQNQDYCQRKTGHRATRMPNGTLRCIN
ncbi:hypothetical protein LGM43_36430 [Burkholderia seminalis]|uniref:hypothetical protein n=1 Tax=Burkholderia seminalis TaxID=488731 RepID=UPI001CF5470E|nr:hypothetical protein [Burkholderia seminalis]MCA7955728.1 hypothetical protein [Burkholderia seminalis]